MLGPQWLKAQARGRLSGIYFKTMLGALISLIPSYIISVVTSMMMLKGGYMAIASIALSAVLNVFVIEIFSVGFLRSLINIEVSYVDAVPEKKYDVNLILSGFQQNFKNTLKIVFLKNWYLFGWEILMVLPYILFFGIMGYLSNRPEIAELAAMVSQLLQSPTETMFMNIVTHITENCMYVSYMMSATSILSAVLIIPYIRKVYEYKMIDILLAENPEITRKEAFAKTREIMIGNRFKYFVLQISFIGLYFLMSIVTAIFNNELVYYIMLAVISPYIYTSYLEFRYEHKKMTERNKTGEECD